MGFWMLLFFSKIHNNRVVFFEAVQIRKRFLSAFVEFPEDQDAAMHLWKPSGRCTPSRTGSYRFWERFVRRDDRALNASHESSVNEEASEGLSKRPILFGTDCHRVWGVHL